MSDDLGDAIVGLTKVPLPGGGTFETDSPVVEAAVAIGIVGAAAYGVYKLFKSGDADTGWLSEQKDRWSPGK